MKLFTLSLSITIEAESFDRASALADSLVRVVEGTDVAVRSVETRVIAEIDEEGFVVSG